MVTIESAIDSARLGFEYMPLDALRIGDAYSYRIPHLSDISVVADAGTVPMDVCEHHPREVGAKWSDGWQDHFLTWAFDVCEHGRERIVMTTTVHETTLAPNNRLTDLTPYQRGFLTLIKSDVPFHAEMRRIFLEWNVRGKDITFAPQWAGIVAPFKVTR